MLPKDKVLLLVRIPQDIEKRVVAFEQLLTNIHEVLRDHIFTFEVTSYNQHLYFFVCIERTMKDLVEGQIYALYPYSEIEEVGDYVQSEVIDRGFSTTEIHLKRSDIIPIKTYKEFEGDSLAGIFSILAKADVDEQIWIQVTVHPLTDSWKTNVSRSWKLKWNKVKLLFRAKNYLKAQSAKSIRELEKESYKEKASLPVFEVSIRLACVAASNGRAEARLLGLTKSYFQFNTIELNGFKSGKAERSEKAFHEYQNRIPGTSFALNARELASVYHFPHPDDVPHTVHVLAKKAAAPRDLPREGGVDPDSVSLFGYTNFHNQNSAFGIKRSDRRRHLYIIGKSGTGKSKLMELLIQEDIRAGRGVALLDPHGDLVDSILRRIPPERVEDVVYFNPADYENPIGFNPLEHVPPEMRVKVTVGFIDILKKLFGDQWNDRMEHILRFSTLAVLEMQDATVLSIIKILSQKAYRQTVVASLTDHSVKSFWTSEFAEWNEKHHAEAIMPILNKLGQFVSTPLIRNIIGQPKNKINLEQIMNEGKILLMRISKGNLGEENAALIGSMVITKLQQAAMARTSIPEEERKDFYLYCDEFQYFATDTFGEILSEARKYRLNVTMAHQYLNQLRPNIRTTMFGNVGTIISFRMGAEDAGLLENEYTPIFRTRDIINLGVREFYVKMSVDGHVRNAFSGRTMNVTSPIHNLQETIIRSSRAKYTRPRGEVEQQIVQWDESTSVDDGSADALASALEEKLSL